MVQVHPQPPSMPSPASTVRSLVELTYTELATSTAHLHSLPASPLQFHHERAAIAVNAEPETMELRVETASECSRRGVQRTTSEPTLPSASSLCSLESHLPESNVLKASPTTQPPHIVVDTAYHAASGSFRPSSSMSQQSMDSMATGGRDTQLSAMSEMSPASQATYEYITYNGTRPGPRTESSLSVSSISTSLASSDTKSPADDETPSPANSVLAEMRTPNHCNHLRADRALDSRPASVLKEVPPDTPQALLSSMVASPSHSAAVETLTGVMESVMQREPIVNEPPVQVAEVVTALPSPPSHSSGTRRLSVGSSVSVASTSNDTESTIQDTHNAALRAGSTSIPAKGPSWHCRSCMKNPCTEPTATMCGHIFCHSCIIKELSTNMQCPACKKVMLLRLYVEAN